MEEEKVKFELTYNFTGEGESKFSHGGSMQTGNLTKKHVVEIENILHKAQGEMIERS